MARHAVDVLIRDTRHRLAVRIVPPGSIQLDDEDVGLLDVFSQLGVPVPVALEESALHQYQLG